MPERFLHSGMRVTLLRPLPGPNYPNTWEIRYPDGRIAAVDFQNRYCMVGGERPPPGYYDSWPMGYPDQQWRGEPQAKGKGGQRRR